MAASSRSLPFPKYDKIIKKPNTRSPIWDYFGLPATENGDIIDLNIIICKLCKNTVLSKGGNTSNMVHHLKIHHPLKYTDYTKSSKTNLPVLLTTDDPGLPNLEDDSQITALDVARKPIQKRQKTLLDFQPLDSNASKRFTEAVAKCLAFNYLSYNLVEKESFIDMLRIFNPKYKLPSRKYFSKTAVPYLYNLAKEKVQQELATVKELSITTDCWSSVTNTPYIAVTAHFIDHQWGLRSACLNCAHFEVNHTSENISDLLKSILSEWNINIENVACCTTDNGSNIVKAIKNLNMTHLSCVGHNINIGINKALGISQLENAVGKLKKLQNSISHSWQMKRDLAKAQELLQMKIVVLPSACPTRWWSTLKLINRFLENQLPISKLFQDYPHKRYLMLESCEISALEDFVDTTKMLQEITTALSGENYVTASCVLPLYKTIYESLQFQDGDSDLCKEIKEKILSPLVKRYGNQELKSLLWISTLCDPRFRLNFTDSAMEIKALAMEKMVKIYTTESYNENISKKTLPVCEKKGLMKIFARMEELQHSESTPKEKAENELNNYLSMPKVDLEINPLEWWKIHGNSFPSLKTLAKIYLPIQGSSVAAERIFSTGGNVITRKRASLLPKNAEMQIFLAENKKFL